MRRTWVALVCAAMVLVAGAQAGAAGAGGGTQSWEDRYRAGEAVWANDLALSPDGATTFVTGYAGGQVVVLARDAESGEARWNSSWPDPINPGGATGRRLEVSPDGTRVYALSYSACSSCPSSRRSWVTQAYDAQTGALLWTSRDSEVGIPYSFAVSADGSTLVAHGEGPSGDFGSETVAMDASDGSSLWRNSRGWNSAIGGHSLAMDASGGAVIVVGWAFDVPGCDSMGTVLVSFDLATGAESAMTQSPLCGKATSVALTPDGASLLVTGTSGGYYAPMKVTAVDTATRAVRWTKVQDAGSDVTNDESPTAVTSADGSTAFVTATPVKRNLSPILTYAYDVATGDLRWRARYDGGGQSYAGDLVASQDGSRLFVAGVEQMPCGSDCPPESSAGLVLALDAATGGQKWVSRYPAGLVADLAASPDGSRVFIAGRLVPGSVSGRTSARAAGCTSYGCGITTASYNNDTTAYRADDTDVAVRWSGWSGRFSGTALGGMDRASRTAGTVVTFTSPSARSVSWVTRVGPSMGRAKVLVDGRVKGTWDLYAAQEARRIVTVSGLADKPHRVQVVATGRRSAAARDAWVVVDAFATALTKDTRQEHAGQVQLGAWRAVARAAASRRSVHVSDKPTARAALRFRGDSVRLLTARGPGFGKARVAVDGVGRTVNLYAATSRWQVPVTFTGLGPGSHTITVTPLGRKDARSSGRNVVVDAFDVRP